MVGKTEVCSSLEPCHWPILVYITVRQDSVVSTGNKTSLDPVNFKNSNSNSNSNNNNNTKHISVCLQTVQLSTDIGVAFI